MPKAKGALKTGDGRQLWAGERIREIREDRRMSQDALATVAGVGKSEISRHETDAESSNPTIDVLARIAIGLEVPLPAVFEPVGTFIPPRPGKGSGHGVSQRAEQHHPLLEEFIKSVAPNASEETWRADIVAAIAALTRALQRPRDPHETTGPPEASGPRAASDY